MSVDSQKLQVVFQSWRGKENPVMVVKLIRQHTGLSLVFCHKLLNREFTVLLNRFEDELDKFEKFTNDKSGMDALERDLNAIGYALEGRTS
jgi:hypothetical protein